MSPPGSPPMSPPTSPPTVYIAPYSSATEGGSAGGFGLFRSNTTDSLTVTYELPTVGGGATPGVDYTGLSGSVTFAVGVGTVGLLYEAIDDALIEGTEAVTVVLTDAPGYTITTGTATLSIFDNDGGGGTSPPPTTPTVSIEPYASATEGGASGVFAVYRSDSVGTLTVTYDFPAITDGAISGVDYTGLSGSVTFAAGQSSAALVFDTIDDAFIEGTEPVLVVLTGAPGYTITNGTAIVDLEDNDGGTTSPPTGPPPPPTSHLPPLVWVSPVSQTVAEGGSGGIWLYRTSGDTSEALTVDLAFGVDGFADPLATWFDDYRLTVPVGTVASFGTAGGTVAFAANQTSLFLGIQPQIDTVLENTEGVRITVVGGSTYQAGYESSAGGGSGGGTGSPAGSATADIRITDVMTVWITGDQGATEGRTSGTFLFSRTGDTSQDLTVTYTVDTLASTATSGTDYRPLLGSVTIAAGWETAFVFVTATDDKPDYDPHETVSLTVTSGSGYSIGSQSSATVTIADSAASTFLLNGNVGHIWYDFPWGEYYESQTSQSVPLDDFVLILAGQTFSSTNASSGTFTTAPTAEFTNGVFAGLKFAINTSGLPDYPFSSVSMNGLIVTGIASVTGQVFQIAAPVEAPKKPTSENLSWKHFKPVQTLSTDAFTSTLRSYNKDDITVTSKPFKNKVGEKFIAEATLNFKFTSEYDPAETKKLNIVARQTAALLKHERLHLALGEYMMKKQLLNLPVMTCQGIADTAEAAEDAAKFQLRQLADSKFEELVDALNSINASYDDITKGSSDKEAQALWEANYTKIMDDALKQKFKWVK